MVGFSQSEDKQMLRQAQIAKYINLLYEDVFQDWSRKNDQSDAGNCPPRLRPQRIIAKRRCRRAQRCWKRSRTSATG